MALQIWLPLNGNLNNQGLTETTVTVTGTTSFAAGKIGQGLSCNGSSFWTVSNINLGSSCSIACWTKTSTNNKMSWVLGSDASNKLNLYQSSVYTLNIGDGNSNPYKTDNNSNITCLHDGLWHHFVVTFNSTISKLYIDGAYAGTAATFRDPTTTNGVIKIGGGYNGAHGYDWNGMINDFRVYDHCLSEYEIKSLSQGLVLHYPLNRGGFGGDNLSTNSGDLTLWNKESGITCVWDSDKQMYKIQSTSTSSRWGIWQQVSCEPNTTYTFSVDGMKVDQTMYLSVGSMASGGWPPNQDAFTTKRNRLSYTWTTGSDHTIIRMYLAIYPTADGSKTGYYALPKLELGDIPTPWLPNSADPLYSAMGLNSNVEYDVSGYGNNLKSSAAHTYSPDSPRYNLCTIFSNASYNAYTASSKNIGLGGNPEFTISAWIYCNDDAWINDYQGIFWFGGQGTNRSAALSIHNGKLDVDFWNNRYEATNQLIVKTWYHIAATKTSGAINSTCKLYVNGQSVAGSGNASSSPTIDTISNIIIGSLNNVTTRRWNGMISDVRVYATALSEDDILELYHTPISIASNGTLMTQGEIVEV